MKQFKRSVAMLLVTSLMTVFVITGLKPPVARADVLSVLEAVYTYVVVGGTTAVMVTQPEVGAAVASAAIILGVKFNSATDYNNFINGFWSFVIAKDPSAYNNLGNFFKVIVVSMQTTVQLQPYMWSQLKDYITSEKSDPTKVVSYNGPVGLPSMPAGVTGLTYMVLISGKYGGQMRYQVCYSTNPMIVNLSGNTVSVTSDFKIYYSQKTGSDAWYSYMSHTGGWNTISGDSGTTAKIEWSNFTTYNDSHLVTHQSNTTAGDYTGTNSTVDSQNPSITTDKGVDVTIPTAKTGSIPTSTVVGQDASTVSTAIGSISGTIANTATATATTPDWYAPKSKEIDWGPLTNIKIFDKFPFCLPWDLVHSIGMLAADPETPKWEISLPSVGDGRMFGGFNFDVDLKQFDGLATVSRVFMTIIFFIALIFVTQKLIRH